MMKILIADDQTLLRESLQIILSSYPDIEIVGTASNGLEVMDAIKKNMPDIILMDIRMPVMDGVNCTREVKERYPQIKIIILTTFDDDEYVFNALKYGASGYLLKGVSRDELYEAIVTVDRGGAMINPDIVTKVVKIFSKMAQSNYMIEVDDRDIQSISRVEKQIIQQVSFGLSNKEIANHLCLSEGTIRNYLSSVLNKLHLRGRTQLAIWAIQSGFATGDFDEDE